MWLFLRTSAASVLTNVPTPSPIFINSHNLVPYISRQFFTMWSHVILDTTHAKAEKAVVPVGHSIVLFMQ